MTPLANPIRWDLIAEAVQHYQRAGYQQVEVPWMVPTEVTRASAPEGKIGFRTQRGDLIGSGEQGLLRLALQNQLPPGRWQTTTPCFRTDSPDWLHSTHFMKVELMCLGQTDFGPALLDALDFFRGKLPVRTIRISENQVDIVEWDSGVELGSYGYREALGQRWVYATGVAEPRLSSVMSLLGA